VHPDQLSLAIGKEGQNVRLAAKLTGWRIDIMEDKQDNTDETKTVLEGAEGEVIQENKKTTNQENKKADEAEGARLPTPDAEGYGGQGSPKGREDGGVIQPKKKSKKEE
jgi:N utilization substance protein A